MDRKSRVAVALLSLLTAAQTARPDDAAFRLAGDFSGTRFEVNLTEIVQIRRQDDKWTVRVIYHDSTREVGTATGLQPAYKNGQLKYQNKLEAKPPAPGKVLFERKMNAFAVDGMVALTPTETGVVMRYNHFSSGKPVVRHLPRIGFPMEVAELMGNWEGNLAGFGQTWLVQPTSGPGGAVAWKITGTLLKGNEVAGKMSGTNPVFEHNTLMFSVKFDKNPGAIPWADGTSIRLRHVAANKVEYAYDHSGKTRWEFLRRSGANDVDLTPPKVGPVADVTGVLTKADVDFLNLANTWHYYNTNRMQFPWNNNTVASVVHEANGVGRRSSIAGQMLIRAMASDTQSQLNKKRRDLLNQFPDKVFDQALAATVTWLGLDKSPLLAEYRPAAAERRFVAWCDNLRRNETSKTVARVYVNGAGSNIAKSVEEEYADKFPRALLSEANLVRFSRESRDEVDFEQKTSANGGVYPNRSLGVVGQFIKLRYNGHAPLTNVLIVGRIDTTGADLSLKPGQARFDNEKKEVAALMQAMNLLETMPTASFIYVPKLVPGDVIRFYAGHPRQECMKGCSAVLYCDQGRVAEQNVKILELPPAP